MKNEGEGKTVETAQLPSFNHTPHITTADGFDKRIEVTLGWDKQTVISKNNEIVSSTTKFATQTELTKKAIELSKQPGYEYLGELINQGNVNLTAMDLYTQHWDFKQQGLTPTGAALLSVAVGWALGPASGFVQTSLGGVVGVMASSAMTSLATQASIILINNQGDLGATMRKLASLDNVKQLLSSILTDGVLAHINTNVMPGVLKDLNIKDPKSLPGRLINAGFEGTATALIDFTVNGGSLEDKLKTTLRNFGVDAIHGAAAGEIASVDGIMNKILHATASCLASAAKQPEAEKSKAACASGAIGGMVSEIVAESIPKPPENATKEQLEKYHRDVLASGKFASGFIAGMAGYDAAIAVSAADMTLKNNYLSPEEVLSKESWKNELKRCENDPSPLCNLVREQLIELAEKDIRSDLDLIIACSQDSFSQKCGVEYNKARQTLKALNVSGDILAIKLEKDKLGRLIASTPYKIGTIAPINNKQGELYPGMKDTVVERIARGAGEMLIMEVEGYAVIGILNKAGKFTPVVKTATKLSHLNATITNKFVSHILSKERQLVRAFRQNNKLTADQLSQLDNYLLGKTYNNKQALKNWIKGCECFTAGTLIHTQDGIKPIETIAHGDMIWSREEFGTEYGYRPVIATKATPDVPVYEVQIQHDSGLTETFNTTEEHPFYIEGEGWRKASILEAGMKLLDKHGKPTATIISQSKLEQTDTVYNFEVQDFHTYHIGEIGVWVHNADCCKVTPFKLSDSKAYKKLTNETDKCNFISNYSRQLRRQENAINSLSPDELISAIESYKKHVENQAQPKPHSQKNLKIICKEILN